MTQSSDPAGPPVAGVAGAETPGHEAPEALAAARRRRAELAATLAETEQALAAPAPGRVGAWGDRVRTAVEHLSVDLSRHIELTEGPDGLYQDVMTQAPRLAHMIVKLEGEHVVLVGAVQDALRLLDAGPEGENWVAEMRDMLTSLLVLFTRHRQRGADLVYEAYDTDIGGGG